MAKGHTLLVGLKEVDPGAWYGWTGREGCQGCELDVDNIAGILKPSGYNITTLKTAQATKENIFSELNMAASRATPEDIFVFYYSGHGSQAEDIDGDEEDGKDETLVTYNGHIVDDELFAVWQKFPPQSRIVMVADCCNAGTNASAPTSSPGLRKKDRIILRKKLNAQLIHFGGCQDGGVSIGFPEGGVFTRSILKAWQQNIQWKGYKEFFTWVWENLGRNTQLPQYNEYGPVTNRFRMSKPFSV